MSDSFTEITSKSWLSRILGSFIGVLVGIALIPGSIYLLSWNEGRSVKTLKSLEEGAAQVVSVDCAAVDQANQNKLIHLSGEAVTTETLKDPKFNVGGTALRLSRSVEMFQWKESEKSETEKKVGGGEETKKTYTYSKVWKDSLVDSSKFKKAAEHQNPKSFMAESKTMLAKEVAMGAFALPATVLEKMSGDERLTVSEGDLGKLPAELKPTAKIHDNAFYFGANPADAQVGDQRVSFKILKSGNQFSILAQQTGNTLGEFQTKSGDAIERVESGVVSAATMFEHAKSKNAMWTWILRAVGFVLMAVGFGLILSPLSVVADVIPFVGNIVGAGTGFAALALSTVGSLTTIAVAWLVVRPVLGGALLAAAVACLIFGSRMGGKRRRA